MVWLAFPKPSFGMPDILAHRPPGQGGTWPGSHPGGGWAIGTASALLYWLILDLPREDFVRQFLYQIPYALLSLL